WGAVEHEESVVDDRRAGAFLEQSLDQDPSFDAFVEPFSRHVIVVGAHPATDEFAHRWSVHFLPVIDDHVETASVVRLYDELVRKPVEVDLLESLTDLKQRGKMMVANSLGDKVAHQQLVRQRLKDRTALEQLSCRHFFAKDNRILEIGLPAVCLA